MEIESVTSQILTQEEIVNAQTIFDKTWASFIKKYGEHAMVFKSKIIFVNGAPGAGKATNHRHIMRMMEIATMPVEVSSLLTSPEAEAIKAKGSLVGDEMVVGLVFDEMLAKKGAGNAILIDGFPRTKIQAYCLSLLIDRLQEMPNNKHCVVSLIHLAITHDVSIERQLQRGRAALEHNKKVAETKEGEVKVVRKTDMSAESAEKRWQAYVNETSNTIALLKKKLEYYEINTEGSFNEVRDRIYNAFSNR